MPKPTNKHYKRGIYLLPNIFTTAALFAAFYSIVASMKGQYESAAMAIFFSMLADALDGRVARLISAQSEFGAQYDSMADMVSFGLAPSLLLYNWSLASLGKLGWLISFMYTATVALRLARFNTQIGVADKRFFQGLACPAGAAVMAGLVWLAVQAEIDGYKLSLLFALLAIMIGMLMVSNIRYYSFKDIDFRGKVPFLYTTVLVLMFVGVAISPSLVLTVCFVVYAASGPIYTLYEKHNKRKARRQKHQK